MKITTIITVLFCTIPVQDTLVNKVLDEINLARNNPYNYGIKYNLNLSYIDNKEPLILDEELSIDCYNWALEMANSNDLKHDESDDNSESIAVTANINNLVNIFIIDKDVPSLGHRHHLLGYGEDYKNDTNIGIGIVKKNNLYWICIRTN